MGLLTKPNPQSLGIVPATYKGNVMTGTERMEAVVSAIESGKTVIFSTYTRAIEVSPKTLAKWRKNGHELFRADEKHLWMASGKSWTCMDYCRITVHE